MSDSGVEITVPCERCVSRAGGVPAASARLEVGTGNSVLPLAWFNRSFLLSQG